MPQNDQYSQILAGISELKGTTNAMASDISNIKTDIRTNTSDLTEHKLGVMTNKEALDLEKEKRAEETDKKNSEIKALDTRLKKVEFFPNIMSTLVKALKWLAGIAIAVLAIAKAFSLW